MRSMLLFCALLLVWAPIIRAADGDIADPIGLKGMMLGAPYSEAEKSDDYTCKVIHKLFDSMCRMRSLSLLTLANAPIKDFWIYYNDETLQAIRVDFSPTNFKQITEALAEKYGPPVVQFEELKNRMGVKVSCEIHIWHTPTASLKARQYDGSLDAASIFLITNAAEDIVNKRMADQAKDNAAHL